MPRPPLPKGDLCPHKRRERDCLECLRAEVNQLKLLLEMQARCSCGQLLERPKCPICDRW